MSQSADVTLPSYETATSRDPIPILTPYIRREDIFSCSLVSRAWHQAFEDRLWGEPANFWELGERNALAGFLKFIHILPVVRAQSRYKVHTLSLERVHVTIYTRLPATWIAELVSLLPNLQNLAVDGFPFFDHSSLMVLAGRGAQHSSSPSPATVIEAAQHHRNIRYLEVSSLTNTTPPSLVQLLGGLAENVEFLDVSYTNGVNHPSTLLAIGNNLKSLRSLKLRGLKLTDIGLEVLCRGVGVRLKRLDVSCNLLTDRAVQVLLDWCVMPPEYGGGGEEEEGGSGNNDYLSQRLGSDDLEDEDAEDPCFGLSGGWMTAVKAFRRRLKDASTSNILPPDIDGRQLPPREIGLTSLSIADNDISVAGVISLIKSERLESLDCGAIKYDSRSGGGGGGARQAAQVTRLIPVLQQYAFKTLQNLRINFQIVCGNGKFGCKGLAKQTGGAGLHSPSHMILVPSSLPSLRHLALVGMPLQTSDETIVENLLSFFDSIPPVPPHEASSSQRSGGGGRTSKLQRRRRPSVLPRCITLEFCSSGGDGDGVSKEDTGMYASSAADDDTSAFHAASSNDFSFFDESYRTDAAEMFGGDEGTDGKWYSAADTSKKQNITITTENSETSYNGVNIADRIREWRLKGSGSGGGGGGGQWEGEIRLVRDFGGKERGLDGEKWGLIIETV